MSSGQSSESRIPFTCPNCGHHTDVEARFAGQSGPCVSCGNVITVPSLEAQLATPGTKTNKATPQPPWVKVGMAIGGVLSLGVLGVVAWSVFQPAFEAAREAAKCADCGTNLLTLGQALEAYYDQNGHYPPAVVYDPETGRAMHSWRVLLLPYLGPEAELIHAKYNFEQPWDSAENQMLIDAIPHVYECPADGKAVKGETSYLAVVGDETVINRSDPTRKSGIHDHVLRDAARETMVILEAAGSGVNWMEPKDISIDALPAGLNSSNPATPGSAHPQGVNILMADESIIRLDETVSVDDLRAMATINGDNEYIEVLDELEY